MLANYVVLKIFIWLNKLLDSQSSLHVSFARTKVCTKYQICRSQKTGICRNIFHTSVYDVCIYLLNILIEIFQITFWIYYTITSEPTIHNTPKRVLAINWFNCYKEFSANLDYVTLFITHAYFRISKTCRVMQKK